MNITSSSFDMLVLRPLEALKSQQAFENVPILRSLESRYFLSAPFFGLVVFISYLTWLSSASTPVVKGPVAGYRSFWEPTFLLRLRFVFNAVGIMNDGYYKFKNSSYVVRRMDTDVTVLALKYLDELRKSGLDELNATHANIHNVLGGYTNLNEMKFNDHFIKAISHCLNPNINEFMKYMQDELSFSFKVDIPDFEGHEWKSIDIHSLLKRIISRVASRIMLGLPYCRDETIISITESHTICIFGVTLILRRFPPILHPLVALLIPHRWRIWRNIREMKKITQTILDEHSAAKASGDTSHKSTEPKTLLKWMIDNAKPHQKSLHSLVSTQLAVTVAAVYTSSQVTSHLLVFLAQNPRYIAEIRKEIADSTNDIENIDPSKLHKMEACLSETLRLNPPQTNAPQRRAMQDITLKDGVVIPKGALVAFPCTPCSMDSSIYPDPQQFIPFRKENISVPVTTPTRNQLAFGWGSQACPGRFLAAKEIKVVAARLLMEYDMEIAPEADKMRRYYDIEDLRVLNPSMRLRMRRRVLEA
ncbi:cytochrome P450 [Melanomma pulvis-pyrius CBS 109.77]|uniref:Cytochrome P450 n=1 Tax=Melanomma pulvis-pyrius CBS 109.77 TaxID=1314802 RepID=A0A6A6XR83_9PLEO|nr:cytochrome P450 [Melanomma pulvis-pyrius CBS 109.77]